MLKGFQQFILRGNVLDLAVAVVMGAAFGGVVTALVKDLLTPLIAAIVGQPDFSVAYLHIADKYLGPLASRLRGVNQPVISTRSVFSTPRSILLGYI
jgi:large conductance mechanosensitive channel protein